MGVKPEAPAEYRSTLRPDDLLSVLTRLAEHWKLSGLPLYGRPGSRIGFIEALAHEVAHRLFTGPDFERQLMRLSPRASNRHEASALRVEVAALGQLGCKVSLRVLYARANWRDDVRDSRPSWDKMLHDFTSREKRCIARMIQIVLRLHQGRGARASKRPTGTPLNPNDYLNSF